MFKLNLRKKVILIYSLFFLSSIGTAIILNGCQSVNEPTILPDTNLKSNYNGSVCNLQKVNASELQSDIKHFAKGLAMLFKQEEFRRLLEEQKNLADNREEILDASKFLNQTITINENGKQKNTTILEEIFSRNKDVNKDIFVNKYKSLNPGILDIYFPVDEHRAKWTSKSPDLLVAAGDHNEGKKKDGKIPAYNCEGDETILTKNIIPETPVLVVTLNETHGKYPPKIKNKANFVRFPFKNQIDKTIKNSLAETNDVVVIDPCLIYHNDLTVYGVFLRDEDQDGWFEGWWDGDPELYVEAVAKDNSGRIIASQRTDFYDVIDETQYFPNRVVLSIINGQVYEYNYIVWWDDDGGLNGGSDLVEQNFREDGTSVFRAFHWFPSGYCIAYFGQNDDLNMDVYWHVYTTNYVD